MDKTVIDASGKNKTVKRVVIAVVVVLAVVVLGTTAFVSIPAGHTGVVLQFGAVSDTVMSEGLHVKIPFVTQVVKVDNRVLKTEVSSTSASKDLQNVSSTIALNYRVDRASSASIYKNVGLNFESVIVNPAIQECVKAVTAKYTAEELITQRQSVSEEMKDLLQQKITSYGLNIEVFNIISFDFSDEFNAAIEAKQTAQQNALKAEQDLARIKVEAEQQVAKAQAEAESYRLKNLEITQATLAMEWIDKWDGKLPSVASDSQMMLNISELLAGLQTAPNSSSQVYVPTTPEPREENASSAAE